MTGTFSNQYKLPQLPIPALADTKKKLLSAIRPLVSNAQYQETLQAVKLFFEDTGEAQKLQAKLTEWDQRIEGSWLKPFWYELYVTSREPLHTSSNFNILVDNVTFRTNYSVASLAGKVCRSVAELYQAIRNGEVEPQKIKGVPIDTSQYPNFFRSIRIPRRRCDTYEVATSTKEPIFIVLMYKGHCYKLQVVDDNNIMLTSNILSDAILSIFTSENTRGPNVGMMTTAMRDRAADIYEQLVVSEVNEKTLQQIANALVVVSIDEESSTAAEALTNLFISGSNKWFDKTFQIVLTKTGEIGYSVEHTAVDGTTSFAVIEYIQNKLITNDNERSETVNKAIVKKLPWEISVNVQSELNELERANKETVEGYTVVSKNFNSFGTQEIKRLKFSPDSFFHMALQVAQYRIFSRMRSTYEAVSMRSYYEGRTECIRPSNTENLTLAKAIAEGEQDQESLLDLMRQASTAHSIQMKEAQRGFGIERHLFGLKKMFELYKEELDIAGCPKLFNDPGYAALCQNFISTSNMTSPLVKSCIFGPVEEDGYGIFYVLLEDRIGINLSSTKANESTAKLLVDELMQALEELREIALV
ncbi:choline/carnitine O-acyltransferase [Sporosarcina sp. PTS2304]|uniref:choline/carnitine O-acyltransferase n=1 Tax=Sporosarcina sp. PTS2304 TaxID=2283194 RepID=UPI000E0DD830|nr:choline/carnitine O-acyltransferase [Sporosarcina sp. PTS2304]AXH99362.1 choline/carnitine O-acyltransferase [Sporosarcina sp. PTS2304]